MFAFGVPARADAGASAVGWAKSHLGTNFDYEECLLFASQAYASAGVKIGTVGNDAGAAQYWKEDPAAYTEHPGDDTNPVIGGLVFWGATPSGPIKYVNPYGHVGLYIGNNTVISTWAYPEPASRHDVFEFPLTGSGSRNAAGYPYLGWLAPPGVGVSGDFNGDGRADIAWYQGTTIYVLESLGNGKFGIEGSTAGIGTPTWAGVGDFNGDGRADIAWYQGTTIYVLESLGNGKFGIEGATAGIGTPTWAGVGDFNGDGRDDIAWYQGTTIFDLQSAGNGKFGVAGTAGGIGTPTWAGNGSFSRSNGS